MMKKYMYLLLLIASVLLIGCKGRNEPSQTNQEFGYIQVLNNTNDSYYVTIKGNTASSFYLDGKHYITKTVSPGYYVIHVKQQTGYYLYPTEKEFECTVKTGQTSVVSF